MATSPKEPAVQSQKRPLEEPSSPTGVTDQPDAKRPALEKNNIDGDSNGDKAHSPDHALSKSTDNPGDETITTTNKDVTSTIPNASEVLQTQPEQAYTAGANDNETSNGHVLHNTDESQWLHLRCIISSNEAATIIGKGGDNVALIRRMSGAKCTVSDYIRGAVERVMTVSGLVDAVAKAFGLIVRTLHAEPNEEASTPHSKTYPLRLLIPSILIGSIIGKQGVRIKEIQEASGARLNVSDQCLPLSTERSLVVLGVADAIHIAVFYVGSTLKEQLVERYNGPAASAYATRQGGAAGVVPGGMQVVPYVPQQAGGQWGPPEYFQRNQLRRVPGQSIYGAQYGATSQQIPNPAAMPYGAAVSPRQSYGGPGPAAPNTVYGGVQAGQSQVPAQAGQPNMAGMPGQPLTQQIYIPNDMVGAIIGKGGAKINEIRQLSGSVIKINEPQDNSNERLVTVTGTQECNQMALYMLYQRLGKCFSIHLLSEFY